MVWVYGLCEQSRIFRTGLIPVEINPPAKRPDLEKLVADIKGKKVGIELTPSLDKAKESVEGIKLMVHKVYLELYERLRQNNEIVFLETEENYQRYCRLAVELHKRGDDMPALEHFRKSVLRDYTYYLARDKEIRRNMIGDSLDFAFIGAFHAFNYAKSDPSVIPNVFMEEEANTDQVKAKIECVFDCCCSDLKTIDRMLSHVFMYYRMVPFEKMNNRESFEQEYRKFLSLARKYSLIQSAVLLDEKGKRPDFVGTWNMGLPIDGFFEVYPENQNGTSKGKILDLYGDAEFSGTFGDQQIEFVKNYTEVLDPDAAEGALRYQANRQNGLYKGSFTFASGSRFPFVLAKYSPETARKILEAENGEKLLGMLSR